MSRTIVHWVILLFSGMLLLTSCATWSGPPPIATAQIDPPSAHQPRLWPTTTTPMPTSAELVWFDDLAAHPEAYENTFVEVHGTTTGLMWHDCGGYQYVGPPTTWGLQGLPKKPGSFEIATNQRDVLEDLWRKPVAVWG